MTLNYNPKAWLGDGEISQAIKRKKSEGIITLNSAHINAALKRGVLNSIVHKGVERMHQPIQSSSGKWNGWNNSEIVMFPGIGNVQVALNVKNVDFDTIPYQIGWHPAFSRAKSRKGTFIFGDESISYHKVKRDSIAGKPLILPNTNKIVYESKSQRVEVNTQGFKHLMIWSPATNMYCIEPLSDLPIKGKPFENRSMLKPRMKSNDYVTNIKFD